MVRVALASVVLCAACATPSESVALPVPTQSGDGFVHVVALEPALSSVDAAMLGIPISTSNSNEFLAPERLEHFTELLAREILQRRPAWQVFKPEGVDPRHGGISVVRVVIEGTRQNRSADADAAAVAMTARVMGGLMFGRLGADVATLATASNGNSGSGTLKAYGWVDLGVTPGDEVGLMKHPRLAGQLFDFSRLGAQRKPFTLETSWRAGGHGDEQVAIALAKQLAPEIVAEIERPTTDRLPMP